VLVVAAALLASCASTSRGTAASGPPSLSSVVKGRFIARVELDHGTLAVVPAGKRKARLPMQVAEAMFRAADVVDGTFRFEVFGLGVVTLSPRESAQTPTGTQPTTTSGVPSAVATTTTTGAANSAATSTTATATNGTTTTAGEPGTTGPTGATTGSTGTAPPTPPLPRYVDRLAWVGIAWGAGCPGGTGGAAPGTQYVAVVLDAQTGASVLAYTSRGTPPCGGTIQPPSVTRASELVSVPWQPVGPASTAVRVTVPACGTFFGWTDVTGAGTAPVQVVAQKPFDPECGSNAPVVQVVSDVLPLGKAQAQVPHAVLGPVDVLRTLAGG